MPEQKITRRVVSNARKQAEARAVANDSPVIDQLDAEAKKLGFRGWRRLIKEFRSQNADQQQSH